MSVSIFDITERQWAQIRAALKFWRQLAEVSRTHPSSYPGVEEEFEEYGPMSVAEIDEFLAGIPKALVMTAQKLANRYGVSKDVVKSLIKKHDLRPDMRIAKTKVYHVQTLLPVVEELEHRK